MKKIIDWHVFILFTTSRTLINHGVSLANAGGDANNYPRASIKQYIILRCSSLREYIYWTINNYPLRMIQISRFGVPFCIER